MKIVWRVISVIWFLALTTVGTKMYLDTPKQIEKDKKFKSEKIDPVVRVTKAFVTTNKRRPTDKEFREFKLDGELILTHKDLPDEFKHKIKIEDWDNDTYAIAVWRGEWYEGFISKNDKYILNDYSTVDGVIGLLITIGVAFVPGLLTLWFEKKVE